MGLKDTQFFKRPESEPENEVKKIMKVVYESLSEKGYNPMYQIVGYILSGDPTYITSHNNARTMISQLERDELLEELVRNYIEDNIK
jgi:uncharacterized protein (UPF0297 family)